MADLGIHESVTNSSGVWWAVREPWWFTEVVQACFASIVKAACEDMDIGKGIGIGVVAHGRVGTH